MSPVPEIEIVAFEGNAETLAEEHHELKKAEGIDRTLEQGRIGRHRHERGKTRAKIGKDFGLDVAGGSTCALHLNYPPSGPGTLDFQQYALGIKFIDLSGVPLP